MRRLVGLCPLSEGLRHKPIKKGEGGVNLQVLTRSVQWENSLHHLKVLTQLHQFTATLDMRAREGRGGVGEERRENGEGEMEINNYSELNENFH